MEAQLLAVLSLGFFLGLKHATDADHVVAVTTCVSQQRNIFRSCWIGAFWGLGHTLSLAIAGLLVIGLKVNISHSAELKLEMAVAAMLVGLGARVLVHRHPERQAEGAHWHVHARPLMVGMVHGAAGSAALMLLVLSTIRNPMEGLVYIGIFGIGSMVGMLIVSLLLALPLHWISKQFTVSYRSIQVAAGAFSCLFGIYLGLDVWSKF